MNRRRASGRKMDESEFQEQSVIEAKLLMLMSEIGELTFQKALAKVKEWKAGGVPDLGRQVLLLQGRIRHLESVLKTRDYQIQHLTNASRQPIVPP